MKVHRARGVAREWVFNEIADLPEIAGAFFHGSINWLPGDAELPRNADLDVMIVLAGGTPPVMPGKRIYRGVLLEVSSITREELGSAEAILSRSELAGSFRAPAIILDSSGELSALQEAVAREYLKRRWVRARCDQVEWKIARNLDAMGPAEPLHDQVTHWLFATGLTTHILLVAGLKNPTVRRRYAAARELLAGHGRLGAYDSLLDLLGCARMSRDQAEAHLRSLARAFDAATAVIRTPFFFASDISEQARPIAIDGSREMIAAGEHREAVFWIVATYARCLKVLHADGSTALAARHEPAFRDLLADLGIASAADLERRGEQVRRSLPAIRAVAESLMAANPAIVD